MSDAPYAELHEIRAGLPGLKVLDGGRAASEPKPPAIVPYVWRPASEVPPREWLYGSHYLRSFVTATFAPGGAGKSALLLAEAIAMATGRPILGIEPVERCRVAYWNGEDPLEETERRVKAIEMHYGLEAEDLEGWFFWGTGRESEIIIAEQGPDGLTVRRPDIAAVEALIDEHKLDVLYIDPFVSCHRVPENDNNAVDVVAKQWGGIAGRKRVSIELSHHTTKAAMGREVRAEDGRGGGALLFAVRSARVLNGMSAEEADAAGVPDDERSWHFKVSNGKANLAPPGRKAEWYRFRSENLGNGHLGGGDSVGAATPWRWPSDTPTPVAGERKPRGGKLNHAAQRIHSALIRLLGDGKGVRIPSSVAGVKPGTMAVENLELRRTATELGLVLEPRPEESDEEATKRWQSACRMAWKSGTAQLLERKVARFEGSLWWLLDPVNDDGERMTSRGER